MLAYYFDLALRSLKRNKVLTILMVVTLSLGIGASMTTLTMLRLLSGDPLPQKSDRLFYPQLDPYPKDRDFSRSGKMPWLMDYVDAMNLLRARKAQHQAAMAYTQGKIAPKLHEGHPFYKAGMMTTSDFFVMFDAPFQYGGSWTGADDDERAKVVVISHALNDRVFGGANSVGRDIRIEDKAYRVVGVLQPWAPQPRFYAVHLAQRHYGDGEDFFLPLQTARAAGLQPDMQLSYGNRAGQDLEAEPVIWLGVWVQLASANEAVAYRDYLAAYAREQIALGRFVRDRVALPDLMQWLQDQQVVPDQARLQTGLALSFLLICIVNTVGLLLAKCLRRSQEIGVRRALGASRSAIFVQFMVEASVIGLAGGVLGLALAQFGLWCVRHQPTDYAGLAHLDATMLLATFFVAWLASLLAGLLPAWRACAIAPALQLKSA